MFLNIHIYIHIYIHAGRDLDPVLQQKIDLLLEQADAEDMERSLMQLHDRHSSTSSELSELAEAANVIDASTCSELAEQANVIDASTCSASSDSTSGSSKAGSIISTWLTCFLFNTYNFGIS
jgi:hypothetical protein